MISPEQQKKKQTDKKQRAHSLTHSYIHVTPDKLLQFCALALVFTFCAMEPIKLSYTKLNYA